MSAREAILGRIRTALGRRPGDTPPELGPPRIRVPSVDIETRVQMFSAALEKLAGKVFVAGSRDDARDYVLAVVAGRTAVCSNSPLLGEWRGTLSLIDGDHRSACAGAAVGITGASYALADTGSLELGVTFTPSTAGFVTGIRFYKGPQNSGTHTGTLWSDTGQQLATVQFSAGTTGGWQTAQRKHFADGGLFDQIYQAR